MDRAVDFCIQQQQGWEDPGVRAGATVKGLIGDPFYLELWILNYLLAHGCC